MAIVFMPILNIYFIFWKFFSFRFFLVTYYQLFHIIRDRLYQHNIQYILTSLKKSHFCVILAMEPFLPADREDTRIKTKVWRKKLNLFNNLRKYIRKVEDHEQSQR